MAGFHSADQLRRDDTPKLTHSVTGPGGRGESAAPRQASWICCFRADDSLEPVTRTDSCAGPGGRLTRFAGASAIAELGA